ncbi:MAG: WG repeat-containing protein [Candidatus Helarchaeota archaeon]
MKIIEHRKKPEKKIEIIKELKKPKEYDYIWDLEADGLRVVELNNKQFLINLNGKRVGKEYDLIYYLDDDGLRVARLNDKYFLINSKGKEVSKEYDYIYSLEDGLRKAELNKKTYWLEVK